MTTEEYERLYAESYKAVKSYIKRYVGIELAEDLAQEVFFVAWKKRDKLKEHDNQMGWLIKTAQYKIKEYRRRFPDKGWEYGLEDYPVTPQDDPTYELVEWESLFDGFMSKREIRMFLEHYYLGVAVGEIAKRERIKESALRMQLQRLKEKIKQNILL